MGLIFHFSTIFKLLKTLIRLVITNIGDRAEYMMGEGEANSIIIALGGRINRTAKFKTYFHWLSKNISVGMGWSRGLTLPAVNSSFCSDWRNMNHQLEKIQQNRH